MRRLRGITLCAAIAATTLLATAAIAGPTRGPLLAPGWLQLIAVANAIAWIGHIVVRCADHIMATINTRLDTIEDQQRRGRVKNILESVTADTVPTPRLRSVASPQLPGDRR